MANPEISLAGAHDPAIFRRDQRHHRAGRRAGRPGGARDIVLRQAWPAANGRGNLFALESKSGTLNGATVCEPLPSAMKKPISKKRMSKNARRYWKSICIIPINSPSGEFIKFCDIRAGSISMAIGIPRKFSCVKSQTYSTSHTSHFHKTWRDTANPAGWRTQSHEFILAGGDTPTPPAGAAPAKSGKLLK